jgi:fatty-acyl-CoA synthase
VGKFGDQIEAARVLYRAGVLKPIRPGGDDKERLGGMVSSGDLGHFDEDGRLFVDGRDDDMIISVGENVFPREVELRVYAKRQLAGYKVPRDVVFIDALPRNATGKVLKRELEQN